ncbi:hypothetical protein Cgig2_033632 [Carnegiea gigantea]|uniref:Reverse transcriptase zinc-binding domain-containing protein n=1 Tax=Carnegiea gigantea TaxID=171969 RepID=A0A9Q1QBL8_9CARY|nr:hypothetical protein Cgig2_033632 [Carnegiea gigantea]
MGIEDFAAWNNVTIAKLTWAVAQMKKVLWVKWVHERYIKNKDWWDYTPPHESSWYWKKGKTEYKVAQGYKWIRGNSKKVPRVEEEESHLFYTCSYAKTFWEVLSKWRQYIPIVQNSTQLLRELDKSKGPRTLKQITCAIISAIFYHIWSARNHLIFKKQQITALQIILDSLCNSKLERISVILLISKSFG